MASTIGFLGHVRHGASADRTDEGVRGLLYVVVGFRYLGFG